MFDRVLALIVTGIIAILLSIAVLVVILKGSNDTTKTLTCSGQVIVSDVASLYRAFGTNMYLFSGGSYTPKQGEICLVTENEVD